VTVQHLGSIEGINPIYGKEQLNLRYRHLMGISSG